MRIIEEIALSNFKSFKDTKIAFRDLNILVGANASGKSNLLSAFQFLNNIYLHDLKSAVQLHGGINNIKNLSTNDNIITISLSIYDGTEKKIQYQPFTRIFERIKYSISIFADDDFFEFLEEDFEISSHLKNNLGQREQEEILTVHKIADKITVSFDGDVSISPFDENIVHHDRRVTSTNTILHLYGDYLAPNLFDFPIYEFDASIKNNAVFAWEKTEINEDGMSLPVILEHIVKDEIQKKKLLRLLSYVLPFIKDVEIEKENQNGITTNEYTKWKVKEQYNSNLSLSSKLLSSGTILTTATIVALFFSKRKIQFFEEPERGVHPAIISALIQLFYEASENKQIFLTTHSPEIVRYCRGEDIILVIRDEQGHSSLEKPIEKDIIKTFLENDLTMESLFIDNLLEA